MKPILEIQNVGKRYKIRHLSGSYLSFRERLLSTFRFGEIDVEDFWALKDISFEVKAGESIGIIGRNGAGKSTLLKILSRITPPTSGRIVSRGRIASLLEVGTGFHPELTGRENIFFNGSLLGMKRREIENKFDEIVDFSGVQKFLDTPLKHYSSGMQLRLAFAVAAFLDPEILIIDEVLAVGDAEFQKKCLRKMEDVTRIGRTLLFVSHNLIAIKSLCSSAVLLDKGKSLMVGETSDVISAYMAASNDIRTGRQDIVNYKLNDSVIVREFHVNSSAFEVFSELELSISLMSELANPTSALCLLVFNAYQERVAIIDLRGEDLFKLSKIKTELKVKIVIDSLPLMEGDYFLGLYLESNLCTGNFFDILKLTIHPIQNSGIEPYPVGVRGMVELKHSFNII